MPSTESRNQGCVFFVLGSQRGDLPASEIPMGQAGAEVRRGIDDILRDSPRLPSENIRGGQVRSQRLRDENYNMIYLKRH